MNLHVRRGLWTSLLMVTCLLWTLVGYNGDDPLNLKTSILLSGAMFATFVITFIGPRERP